MALARAQVGRRYVFGGQTPARGFDCSGLIRHISSHLALELPRTAAQQAAFGKRLPRDTTRLLPGDLLTFGNGTRITHVRIYVGDGRFIHARNVAGRVVESRLGRKFGTPWRGRGGWL